MIIGIGTDLVCISRIRRLIRRFPHRIGAKIFTPAELMAGQNRPDSAASLAGRFAAKEAVLKALGTGWSGGARFIEIEITTGPNRRPLLRLHGKTAEIARDRGIERWHISIAHEGDMVLAVAVGESMVH
jgi:holo-[acyl-carrier protein] synthase